MKTILLLAIGALTLSAQPSQRQVTLTWEDLVNPAGTTYNVYRAQGQCSTTQTFVKVASGLAAKTATDTVNPGQYCYYATATFDTAESDASLTAGAKVKPGSPQKFTVQVGE